MAKVATFMNSKEKAILDRIKHLEDAISKGREFLETGKHGDWHRFQPMFVNKVGRDGVLPPHRDWIKNVFLPRQEKLLKHAQKSLERLNQSARERRPKIPLGVFCVLVLLAVVL
jgi:hypothetical protein